MNISNGTHKSNSFPKTAEARRAPTPARVRSQNHTDSQLPTAPAAQPSRTQSLGGQLKARSGFQKGMSEFAGGSESVGKVKTTEQGDTVTKTKDGYTHVLHNDGTESTVTPGGYKVDYNPEEYQVTMTDLQSGESSVIWGDPHVSESDGDGSFWDYDNGTSTFVLADGTKITTQATNADGELDPYGLVTSLDVYSGNGNSRISSGLDKDPKITNDARWADAQQDDGSVYYGNREANDWYRDGYEMLAMHEGDEGFPFYL